MKKRFSFVVSIILLLIFLQIFLTSCASISNPKQKEILLLENLSKWKSFKLHGIVEMNYKQFVFRKNIFIKKQQEHIELKVFDGGVFGMRPEPFITAIIDSLIWVKMQDDVLKSYDPNLIAGIEYLKNPDLFLPHIDEIIRNQKLLIDNTLLFHFSKNMELNKIEQVDSIIKIEMFYNSELSEIIVTDDEKELIKIDVDKMIYKQNKQINK